MTSEPAPIRALVTGASGSGTSTLAAALAARWHAASVEADALFWMPTGPPFRLRRDPVQRRALFDEQLRRHERVVVAGSIVGWNLDVVFDLVVFLRVETSVRIERLRAREIARCGKTDPAFLEWAAQYDEGPPEGRSLCMHEDWLRTLTCPVIRLVGARSVAEQVALVAGSVPGRAVERAAPSPPAVASVLAILAGLGVAVPPGRIRLDAYGDSEALSDELLALIRSGRKRAGTSLLWGVQVDCEELPAPGDIEIVLDFHDRPVLVTRVKSVDVVPFSEVTAAYAAIEGEGDGSLEHWRRGHWAFFGRECARIGRAPSPQMPVVCSVFDLIAEVPHEGVDPPSSPNPDDHRR